ncbi:MAG: nucleotidyltransferase domain-containing protein [Bacteroidetes bacterium]|nr:nucleotidyltransferase domain-containing protein [Bacteroidota bacterium]
MPFNPVMIGIFGSRARGDNKIESDLDILYQIDKRNSLMDLVRMEKSLSELLDMKVDLTDQTGLTNQRLKKIY